MNTRQWFKSGSPWIWLTGGMISLSMIMVFGLLALIAVRGLGHFWPAPVVEFEYHPDPENTVRVLGNPMRSQNVTGLVLRESGHLIPEDVDLTQRFLIKQGNRDLTGRDFFWYPEPLISEWTTPREAMVVERREWGDFIGFLSQVKQDGVVIAEGYAGKDKLLPLVARANELAGEINHIERYEIGGLNMRLERIRLAERGLERNVDLEPAEVQRRLAELQAERDELDRQYEGINARRLDLLAQMRRDILVAESMDGRRVEIPLAHVVHVHWPNDMTLVQKMGHYVTMVWGFLSGFPREANTEGGIFPAIFGTVLMVILMSIVVTPMGVLAAIYLREYAKQGPIVRLVRISVNNLAGVPSIVFGVFGLAFFVYFVGGNLDRMFYQDSLPAPTFGTPGLVWASLTLALLTLPVVIVSTEEGLARIPSTIRHGSLALGATKAETLWRTVIPLSTPAMMTGLILAVARAAGEVAPLMLVGVVKLAPNLPVDGYFPYLHLERKFMHLGFHIYDVGFQSPNVEASRPLVYATALVLVLIIITLNLTAITIRNYLREKYRSESD
ncbi:phosphate transport system permease protein [Desulfonatronum thiosulfatophilum]|uniref:Phosphate transport system permease protein PstA n=1 Tax=Desulfonatronum thiosulfatophilum TaxID=617002 RepID=A0A1G6DJ62_9BACT|nr:phosphate ABC transporter permease PstA [Desulfonatronum thiosulfatophilum]SDB45193.1 phosphate transport system permease protein [Desulfonatronum thiosulfatophilum]